jgi:hypothetical protein
MCVRETHFGANAGAKSEILHPAKKINHFGAKSHIYKYRDGQYIYIKLC